MFNSFVILSKAKNLDTFTLCIQILRFAQNDTICFFNRKLKQEYRLLLP